MEYPSLKLFRAKNAPLIISFLYSEFKEKKRLNISYHEMENNSGFEIMHSDL